MENGLSISVCKPIDIEAERKLLNKVFGFEYRMLLWNDQTIIVEKIAMEFRLRWTQEAFSSEGPFIPCLAGFEISNFSWCIIISNINSHISNYSIVIQNFGR